MHQRTVLLDAAAAMLIERGYAGLRFQDVSGASGVPVASLRHYFPSLEVLRNEAVRHKVRIELARMTATLAEVSDPWQRIRLLIENGIDLDPQTRRDGWVLWLEFWRAAAHHDELVPDIRELHHAWLDLVHQALVDGVERGDFRLDQTAREAALEFFAVLDGFGLAILVDDSEVEAEMLIAAVDRAARRMLGLPPAPQPRS